MEAFTDALAPTWERFLRSLPGEPQRVVCDAHSGMLGAIGKLWPQTDLYLCEWHLEHALRRLLKKQRRDHKQLAAQIDPLIPQVEAGLAGQSFWDRFKPKLLAVGLKAIDNWVATNDPILQWQFARRGWNRPANMPLSTGGLEQLSRPVRDAIHPRRYVLKTRTPEPAPHAYAAPRQRPRQPDRIRQDHPRLAPQQRRPAQGPSPRGGRPHRRTVTQVNGTVGRLHDGKAPLP
jgi:hypothetical protein